MLVTRLKRRAKGVWTFPDGYRYEWPPYGGEIDVLPQHVEQLLQLDGFEAVEVDAVDPPLILPAFELGDPLPSTVEPPAAEPDVPLDLSDSDIEPAVLPDPPPAPATAVVPEQAEERLDLSGARVVPEPVPLPPGPPVTLVVATPDTPVLDLSDVPVQPPVLPAPAPPPATATQPLPVADVRRAEIHVSDRWSEQELEQARREGSL